MGRRPALRAAILSRSLSTQTTSFPRSANTAPVTSPTYPVPTTQMFMSARALWDSKRAAPEATSASEEMPEEPLGDHPREQQQEIEVREEEEGQPAALVVRLAGELDGEPQEPAAPQGGQGEGDGPADAEGGSGQRPSGQPRGVEEDEARRSLDADHVRHHGEAS